MADESTINTIKVNVLFFASARELAGVDKTTIELLRRDGEAPTTLELRAEIRKLYPRLEDVVATITLAINQEYLEPNAESPLNDRDEVALIPPISGG